MEALYAKLYEKYTTLKKKKFSELDDVNREQEEKFLNFVSASEALTQHLRSENENLKGIVEKLTSEISSIRSSRDEERLESQKCLFEEERKNKALSEEVDNLKELIKKGDAHNYKNKSGRKQQERKSPESTQVTTRSMRKRSRQTEDMVEKDMVSPPLSIRHKPTAETLLLPQPQCCKTTDDGSGNSAGCPFHALGEHLLGMELSTNNEGERVCIIASHPLSGLSFSLTLVNNSTGEESELLYKVLSLGTFVRVAPKWMRDVIKFSTSMSPVFFDRVSRVINRSSSLMAA